METRFFFLTKTRTSLVGIDAPIICVKAFETGYYPIYVAEPEKFVEREQGDKSPEIMDAAFFGSMFGWDVPGAQPAREYAERQAQPA